MAKTNVPRGFISFTVHLDEDIVMMLRTEKLHTGDPVKDILTRRLAESYQRDPIPARPATAARRRAKTVTG